MGRRALGNRLTANRQTKHSSVEINRRTECRRKYTRAPIGPAAGVRIDDAAQKRSKSYFATFASVKSINSTGLSLTEAEADGGGVSVAVV